MCTKRYKDTNNVITDACAEFSPKRPKKEVEKEEEEEVQQIHSSDCKRNEMQRLQSLKRKSARNRLRFIHLHCSGNKWVGIFATIKHYYFFQLHSQIARRGRSAILFARAEKLQAKECHHGTAQENDLNDDEFINECVKNEK